MNRKSQKLVRWPTLKASHETYDGCLELDLVVSEMISGRHLSMLKRVDDTIPFGLAIMEPFGEDRACIGCVLDEDVFPSAQAWAQGRNVELEAAWPGAFAAYA